ncbi:hypothetical protein [Allomuricauda sp. d1]|uniref:hypothetical protein n=1 Tax=Allomuricauda sp. d1 TaxID=3136725 RepID=UPI0031E1E538
MKYLNLVVGILALINVVYTFFSESETSTFFGMEISIWLYRLIWLILAALCFYGYYTRKVADQK